MQKVFGSVVLAAMIATSAPAQQLWQREIGIQGGFARIKPAGTGQSDHVDAITLPGFSLGGILPSVGSLYAVFPWKRAIAIETDIAASQFTTGITVTSLSLGLRGNYAVTQHLYTAVGGALTYDNGLANETQLGVHAAFGYRLHLSRALNARVEARAAFFGNAENLGPINTYSLLFGVSTPTGRGGARAVRAGTARAWTPQIGIAGGYANVHLVGGGSLSALAFPGYGGGLGPLTTYQVTLPPTLFVIIPVGSKIAIEPGLDIHRYQQMGAPLQTDFSGNLSARLNYAVHGGWYAALGGNLHYIKTTGADGTTRTGVNLAWGYRFALAGPFSGRVEANYTMFRENTDLGLGPVNTFGLMFGTTVPLK